MQKNKPHNMVLMWLIGLYLFVPLFLTLVYSFFTEWMNLLPTGFTLKYYWQLFGDVRFWKALGNTLMISVFPVLLTAVLLLLVMYVILVYHPGLDRYLSILCTIPYAIQGVILPISVVSLYTGMPGILSNRLLLLIFTYCIVILPYMYQGIKNSLAGIETKRILEAAQLLGASDLYAFFRIIVPSIAQSVLISSLLALAIIFGDFVIVNTVAGSYYSTVQVYLYRNLMSTGQFVSAIIVVLFCVTFAISLVAFKTQKKK